MNEDNTYEPKEFEAEVISATLRFSPSEIRLYLFLAAVCVLGMIGYFYQLKDGLIVTSLNNYVSWGLYISMLFFFVGISLVGALISSVLRFVGKTWPHPISRIGEAITISAVLFAGLMPVFDMGRPGRLIYLFIDGRIQSPILWDIVAIITYLIGSILFFYLPLIPDMAKLKNNVSGIRKRIYTAMSVGWKDTPGQKQRLEKCNKLMALVILPVAISVHTISAWLIAMTPRPGWNSTIMGPYFVFGALMAGSAVLILVMALLRKLYRLEHIITAEHFKYVAMLTLALCAFYLYLNINKYVVPAYLMEKDEKTVLTVLLQGHFSFVFWFVMIVGLVVPIVLLSFAGIRNTVKGGVFVSFLVLLGALLNRYIIVVPNMLHPFLPIRAGHATYFPSKVELAITLASLAGFLLLVLILTKFFPAIPIEESEEAVVEKGLEETGMKGNTLSVAGKVLTVLAFMLIGLATAAQEKVKGGINVKVISGDSVNTVKVTIMNILSQEPLKGVDVNLSIQRFFGNLSIADVNTNEKGEATASFDSKLPGTGEKGLITIIAKVEDSDILNDTLTKASVKAKHFISRADPETHGLTKSKAPTWLVLTFILLVGTVWLVFAYVVYQIILLKRF